MEIDFAIRHLQSKLQSNTASSVQYGIFSPSSVQSISLEYCLILSQNNYCPESWSGTWI